MTASRSGLRSLALLVAAAMLLLAFAACGGDDEGDAAGEPQGGTENSQAAPSPNDEGPGSAGTAITVNSTEYAFDLPETLPAGETTFTLVNKGKEQHMLIMAELKPGAPSIEELVKMDEKEANKFIVDQQTINPIKPDTTSEKTITFDLKAGATYGYVCFVPSPKKSEGHGQPHAFLGMLGTFTVE